MGDALSTREELLPQAPEGAEPQPGINDERVVVAVAASAALYPNTSQPPVPRQSASHINAAKLESEKVVIAAPLSFAGSAARIWRLTGRTANPWGRIGLGLLAILLIAVAWVGVLAWYLTWGVYLIPYRLIRRGSRKRKRQALQHREMLAALNKHDPH
jgi:hypothetical protein